MPGSASATRATTTCIIVCKEGTCTRLVLKDHIRVGRTIALVRKDVKRIPDSSQLAVEVAKADTTRRCDLLPLARALPGCPGARLCCAAPRATCMP
eukprot:scaffold109244_cov48-Phaeocystis_antarctica.AAC.3